MSNINEEEIKYYKCPACGSTVHFNIEKNNLVCDSCGNEYEIETMQAMHQGEAENEEFDWGDYKKGLCDEKLKSTRVYVCKSCGAEIEADPTTFSLKCPYCDNNVILEDKASGSLRPNGIIPFAFTVDKLSENVKAFYKDKKLLPKDFFEQNKMNNVQGVYVPFWLFDCDVDGQIDFKCSSTHSYRRGDYQYTEVKYYLVQSEGKLGFEKVPVDASTKMPDALMDSLEPFDMRKIVDFNDAYLAGYTADRFDGDPDTDIERANIRVMNSTVNRFAAESGYLNPQLVSNRMKLVSPSVKYVLLPVYLFNCTYGGKKYSYAVNGQTGKVVGELPISKSKSWAWFGGVFAGVAAVVAVLAHFLFG